MIYIDTEGSFLVQRVVDMAAAVIRHCSLLVKDDEQRDAMTTFTVETILSNIFLVMTCRHGNSSHTQVLARLMLFGCRSLM